MGCEAGRGIAVRTLVPALLIPLLVAAMPATAQLEYVKAPISIENALLQQPGAFASDPVSVAIPVSETIVLVDRPDCAQNPGLLEVSVNNNVLELSFSGVAETLTGSICPVDPKISFDVVVDIPIVGPYPAAFVYLVS